VLALGVGLVYRAIDQDDIIVSKPRPQGDAEAPDASDASGGPSGSREKKIFA
jgi:hypothetical protein